MRRVLHCLLVCMCSCMIVFSTGCSYKSLVCTSDESIDGNSNLSQKYTVYFNNDKLERISIDVNVSLNESDEKTVSAIETYVGNAFDSYNDIKGVDYNSNIRDDGFSIFIYADFNNINKSDLNKFYLINYEKGFDELKLEFEQNGFNCR